MNEKSASLYNHHTQIYLISREQHMVIIIRYLVDHLNMQIEECIVYRDLDSFLSENV